MSMAMKDEESHRKMEFFSTNSMVEVSRDKNGAWYVAKILSSYYSSFHRIHKFLVQYQTLISEFHPNDLLTECVDSSFLRPLPPPPAADQSYVPLDIVDAFHRGGWWKGVVTKVGVLEVNSKSIRYIVVFGNPPEKSHFCSKELRFHSDWTDGKWVRPPQLKLLINRPQCEEQSALATYSSKNLLEQQSNPLIATSTSEKLMKPAPETEETLPNYSDQFIKENSANPSSPEQSCVTSMLMKSAEQDTNNTLAKFSTCESGRNLPLAGSNNPNKGSDAVSLWQSFLNGANRQEAGLEKGMAETSNKREIEMNAQVTGLLVAAAVGEDNTNENHLEAINEGNVKNLNQSSAVNVQAESKLVKNHEMPFTKSSIIWQFIDSLQVFQFLPQKPHFRPLLECNEATREGSAIGHTWNFANLVEMASKLQIENPTTLFKSYLEALADLELLGFDVKAVVDRINKLLSIKTRQEQLHDQSRYIHSKIAECDGEKAEIEEEINAIDKTISELKAERAMKLLEKAMKDSESNLLQMDANRINEDMSNAKLDFVSQAAAPW